MINNFYPRRKFIKNACLGTAAISFHHFLQLNLKLTKQSTGTHQSSDLIKNIRLQTMEPLESLREFYAGKLGLEGIHTKPNEITFQVNRSTITFVKIADDGDPPWYHFAFNIPQNMLLKARDWHLKHSPLIETPERLRDPRYPDDVRHFRHWNAHSLFFYDPAGNLLEYIARHDLKNDMSGSFGSKQLLNISEIAFVVDDQEAMAREMQVQLGVPVYPKNANFWWSMGDEHGLLLAIPKRIWGENTSSPKRFGVHPTEATIRGETELSFKYDNYPYKISQMISV